MHFAQAPTYIRCIFYERDSINSKIFPLIMEYANKRKFNKDSGERKSLKEFKEIWKDVSLKIILKDKSGKQHCLPFCSF